MAAPTPNLNTDQLGSRGTSTVEADWTTTDNFANTVVVDRSALVGSPDMLRATRVEIAATAGLGAKVYVKQDAQDTNQGSVAYDTNNFDDDGQDFTDWESDASPADYMIVVIDGDSDISWGYLGAAASATKIAVYQDRDLSTAGWNGDGGTGTASTYEIRTAQYDSDPGAGNPILVGRLPIGGLYAAFDFSNHPAGGIGADGDIVITTTSAASGDELFVKLDWEAI